MRKSPTLTPVPEDTGMYAKHQKVYPREVHGMFARWRVVGVFSLLSIYYVLPWLRWGDHQAFLLDLPARKFHILAWTFWPQDFFFLALLLIIAALSLFFFTALAGRLWCGYACPQTVWTEVFLWMERKIEGDRNRQIKLATAPWGLRKLAIKSAKQVAWIGFALFTGFTFVGYFTPILDLGVKLFTFELGPWETFWIFFYGLATYGNAGWLREQVCIYMCPYARFQSAMFDDDTLIISYDAQRGEPRGARKRGLETHASGLGDCVDCTLCVQACPTGIDIRNGLQYQCIGCSACIDACDTVMDKMGYAKGLIRYTTEHALRGQPTRLLRPRIYVYSALLLLLLSGLVIGLSLRMPLQLDIVRDRNSLYRETASGLVENVYTLRILNMDAVAHRYELRVSGPGEPQLTLDRTGLDVPAGEVRILPASVSIDPAQLTGQAGVDIQFTLQAEDDARLVRVETARFLGPRL